MGEEGADNSDNTKRGLKGQTTMTLLQKNIK